MLTAEQLSHSCGNSRGHSVRLRLLPRHRGAVKSWQILTRKSNSAFTLLLVAADDSEERGPRLALPARNSPFAFFRDVRLLRATCANLREVLAMSETGKDPWYVGWKNRHPRILDAVKQFYSVPHLLPDDTEIPYNDYIFLGYEEGAVMHLDYISRLMWQAQVMGKKTWTVAPTPECHSVCKSFEFSVLTRQTLYRWTHGFDTSKTAVLV